MVAHTQGRPHQGGLRRLGGRYPLTDDLLPALLEAQHGVAEDGLKVSC